MKKRAKKEDDSLQQALAASFQTVKAPARDGAAKVAEGSGSPVEQRIDPPLAPEGSTLKKTTVAFHASEQTQIDKILDLLLQTRRHRGGFSDAVKVALRLCPLDGERIGKAWDEARAEDRRTKRGKTA